MTLLEYIRIGFAQLWGRKLQSALTLLGMVIGVGSVIGIVSIGEGLQRSVFDEFGKIGGTNLIWVTPRRMVIKNGRWVPATVYEPLTWEDVTSFEKSSDRIVSVLPVVSIPVELRYKKATYAGQLEGSLPGYVRAYQWAVESGRFFNDGDVDRWRSVCVLGGKVVERLFGKLSPVGREIKLNGRRYVVVGVMEKKEFFGTDWGNRVLAPITTVQKRVSGSRDINTMVVITKTPRANQGVSRAIKAILRKRHNEKAEYQIQSGQGVLDQVDKTIAVIKIMVGGIAGISLLVGGIGIMNMMLVSVTERTREIGIRMAVGARSHHILFQFTVEAVSLSLAGGIAGVCCGVGMGAGITKLIAYFSDAPFPSAVSPASVALALGISFAIGLFFGIYPAVRASKMNPVEALKYEG